MEKIIENSNGQKFFVLDKKCDTMLLINMESENPFFVIANNYNSEHKSWDNANYIPYIMGAEAAVEVFQNTLSDKYTARELLKDKEYIKDENNIIVYVNSITELKKKIIKFNSNNPGKTCTSYITFSNNSFAKDYPIESRTYKVLNNNKFFKPNSFSLSLFGDSLDGVDKHVKLSDYIFGEEEDRWEIEECWIEIPKENNKNKIEIKGKEISSASDAVNLFKSVTASLDKEQYAVFGLNLSGQVGSGNIYSGNIFKTYLDKPSELFEQIKRRSPVAIIIHNDPLGTKEADSSDIENALHLMESGKSHGVMILDYITVTDNGNNYLSFKADNIFSKKPEEEPEADPPLISNEKSMFDPSEVVSNPEINFDTFER